jgi:hypothetical protein
MSLMVLQAGADDKVRGLAREYFRIFATNPVIS